MSAALAGRYDGIAGILSVGRQDKGYRAVPVLVEAATKAGMTVSTCQYDGARHLPWGAGAPTRSPGWAGLGIAPPSPVS